MTATPKMFVPSSEKLYAMMDDAFRRCDAAIERERLAKEERDIARMERALCAAAKAQAHARRWRY